MAISIDWGTKVITVPRDDLIQVQAAPIAVYELNINDFRLELRDLEDDELGIPHVDTHIYVPPTTVSGVTLARVVEIINGYTVTFSPNESYGVNIVGGNSNIADRTNPNNVSVRSANSAGLQDSESLQASSFGGHVTIDIENGVAGTTFPRGTEQTPVNNIVDAHTIADERGISRFLVKRSITLADEALQDGYTFYADRAGVLITIDPTADVTNCTFQDIGVTGTLDSNNRFYGCEVFNATSLDAILVDCLITGSLTLGGNTQTELINCASGIAGAGPGQYPVIDMGGAGNDLLVRDYSGGLGIENFSDATSAVSIDMDSGRVVLDSTVTAGTVSVRGIAEIEDNSTGTTVVNDRTLIRPIYIGAYNGSVYVDPVNGVAGTEYPVGTPSNPVSNIADAHIIAESLGFLNFAIMEDLTITGESLNDGYTFSGTKQGVTLTAGIGADLTNASFHDIALTGDFGGNNRFTVCELIDVTTYGLIEESGLFGTLTLTGTGGIATEIINSHSNVAGGGVGQFANIDMNTSGNDLVIRSYVGGLGIENLNDASVDASADFVSGRITFFDTCTTGQMTVRGNCQVVDNSTGTFTVNDKTLNLAIEAGQYSNAVIISSAGVSGTDYPIGTISTPVDNIADALTISSNRGINVLRFLTDFTLVNGDNVSLKKLEAQSPSAVELTFEAGSVCAGSSFENVSVTGVLASPASFKNCLIYDITGATVGQAGIMQIQDCGLYGTITLASALSGSIEVTDCNTTSTDPVVFNLNGSDVDVFMARYSGPMTINTATRADKFYTIQNEAGDINLSSSNTEGTFTLYGTGTVNDSTNGSTVIDKTTTLAIEAARYQDMVHVSTGGVSGTDYPIGTHAQPVNNWTDAVAIATNRGISKFHFMSDFTFTNGQSTALYTLAADSPALVTLTFQAGAISAGTSFSNVTVEGELTSPATFRDCVIQDITGGTVGVVGLLQIIRCAFNGTVTLSPTLAGSLEVMDCVTATPDVAIFDLNGANVDFFASRYSGRIRIANATSATSEYTIHSDAGIVELASTCTAGIFNLYGSAKVQNDSTGSTINNRTVMDTVNNTLIGHIWASA